MWGHTLMAKRCAVLIESDENFLRLVQECLEEYDCECFVSEDPQEGLENVRQLRPDVIFVAVDLPDKEGFSIFSKVRASARRVPIVLSTSTLPEHELTMHARLRVHADVYLDKRTVSREDLLDNLDKLLNSGGDAGGTRSRDERGSEGENESGQEPEAGDAALDDEEPGSDRVAELVEEVSQLEGELEDLRHAARSSPFSKEFQALQKDARQKELEAGHLREEIAQARESFKESEGHRKQAAKDMRTATLEMEQEKQAHIQTRQQLQAEAEELRTTIKELLRQAERDLNEGLTALQRQLVQDKVRAVAAAEAKWEKKLGETRRELVETIEAERQSVLEESEELGRLSADEIRQTSQVLAQEQQAHEETRSRYEVQLAEQKRFHDRAKMQFEEHLEELKKEVTLAQRTAKDAQRALAKKERAIMSMENMIENLSKAIEKHRQDISDKEETIDSMNEILGGVFRG